MIFEARADIFLGAVGVNRSLVQSNCTLTPGNGRYKPKVLCCNQYNILLVQRQVTGTISTDGTKNAKIS